MNRENIDSFDKSLRQKAFKARVENLDRSIPSQLEKEIFNLHMHTFFSYNAYGYSPLHIALLAREKSFSLAGVVDFDVLDALEEFTEAGRALGLKTCVGVESRVFVPEFSTRVINSPGEPGISYHVGIGFTTSRIEGWAGEYLADMREKAAQRNRELVDRVNAFTHPVVISYDNEVLPLTPNGNATERHICLAYARKAAAHFKDASSLASFWADKLNVVPDKLDLPDGAAIQGFIRAKTMKRGGVAYVQPGKETFPLLADMNRFILESGAIPAITWLDGTSEGERDIDELIEVEMKSGAAVLNIIPDRNFTAGVKDEKLQKLCDIIEKAAKLDLPLVVGTEMNSPGNKIVDDFHSAELEPFRKAFLDGAYIIYAHTALRRQAGLGYLGEWAGNSFGSIGEKNEFFAGLGRALTVEKESRLSDINEDSLPGEIMDKVKD